MYNATVEVAKRRNIDVDKTMAALAEYHPSIGQSPDGYASATISVPAESLAQACATAAAVVSVAYGAEAIACTVMTEAEFLARQGYAGEGGDPDEQLSVTEVAELLEVSRQAVLQRIRSGSLPAERKGHNWLIRRSAVRRPA